MDRSYPGTQGLPPRPYLRRDSLVWDSRTVGHRPAVGGTSDASSNCGWERSEGFPRT